MSLRNLGLSPAEVDEITRSIFGQTETMAVPNQSPATQQAAPTTGSGMTIAPSFIPVKPTVLRPVALDPVTATIKDNKRVLDAGSLLPRTGPLPTPVVAKQKSALGPVAAGAGAGLLVGGPVGAAIGAGAGFLFSKLR